MNERSLDQSRFGQWMKFTSDNSNDESLTKGLLIGMWVSLGYGNIWGLMRHPEAGNDGEPLPHRRLKKQGEEIIYPKSSDVRAALNSWGDKATLRDRHQSREGEIRNMPNPLPPTIFPPTGRPRIGWASCASSRTERLGDRVTKGQFLGLGIWQGGGEWRRRRWTSQYNAISTVRSMPISAGHPSGCLQRWLSSL